MIPSALCDLISQILGPLTEIPVIGDLFVSILAFVEQFCEDGQTS